MYFVKNFNRTTLAVIERELEFLNLNIFICLVTLFSVFFTLFTIYNLNDSYFIYRNFSTFQIKHVSKYSRAIVVLKFKKFHFLVTLF